MDILYKNNPLERILIGLNAAATAAVAGIALGDFGFYEPLFSQQITYAILICSTLFFIAEKIIRFFNARSKKDYFAARWFELIFIVLLLILFYYAGALWAMSIYLLLEIITKICRTLVNLAASGKSPAIAMVGIFIFLILTGTVLLMLPKSNTAHSLSFIDSLFTATSATCVTGLVVKDTGTDFTIVGQTIILVLIQLGGLGIVIFGAVFALFFGQALNVRQSVAMQDLLNAQTVSRIANIITFIFITTIGIEAIGAVCLYNMWDISTLPTDPFHGRWFYSIFHSVSAFCNAGFGLFSDSLVKYNTDWRIYTVIGPLIILGGLGFFVLYNLAYILKDRIIRIIMKRIRPSRRFETGQPKRIQLQTKIVLFVSSVLIIFGTFFLLAIQNNTGKEKIALADAFFQSVTARTAGFNSIDINALSVPAKMILMILMFIGGSPGSAAGGIKTVTLAILIMAVYSTIRKRTEVEIFNRCIPLVMVGKALTVILMFTAVLFTSTFLLAITERGSSFETSAIAFEAASALGTVGLTCGITPALTTVGKIIIIITMLIGRLGPLTLLATLTFNIKPARFNYPTEAVVVG
jgi:trk system potassium uptake protein TrkH